MYRTITVKSPGSENRKPLEDSLTLALEKRVLIDSKIMIFVNEGRIS
jgi:hypothetical protein